jgi:hypothetical protein
VPNIYGQVIIVGPSPFTYVNPTFNTIEHVLICGGTVTSVAVLDEGVSRALNAVGLIGLRPGRQLIVTYTVAPTMVKLLGAGGDKIHEF